MKISVIQQSLGMGYNHRSAIMPDLDSLRAKAEARLAECFSLIEEAALCGAELAVTIETVNAYTVLGDTRYDYTELYDGVEGETVRRFSALAKRLGIFIVAGLLLTLEGEAYIENY